MKKILAGLLIGVLIGFVAPAFAGRSGGTFTYSTGAGPIVSGGQTISSTWANTSLTDIRDALTDSLSRSGSGGMTAPLELIDGSAGTPGTKFVSSNNTGIYYTSDNSGTFNISTNGGRRFYCSSAGCVSTVDVTFNTTFAVAGDVTFNSTARFKSAGTTTKYTSLKAASGIASDYTLTLPTALPTSSITAWSAYTCSVGDIRSNDSGKIYVCATAGTSVTGPTGTTNPITDGGSAVWRYIAADATQALGVTAAGDVGYATPPALGAVGNALLPMNIQGAYVYPAGWTAITVGGTGCSAGSVPPSYTTRGGVVYMRGTMSATAGNTCTLSGIPAGFRPGSDKSWMLGLTIETGPTYKVFSVTLTSGGVWGGTLGAGTATTTWRFDHISYPAEN